MFKFLGHWNKRILPILIGLFIFGLTLRVILLPFGAMNFFYDQGRDFFIIRDLLHGDFKLMGPPSSMTGFHHGVLYYYLAVPWFWLGHGNPAWVATGLALINSLGILVCYFFSRKIGINQKYSLVTSVLYAVSLEQTQYATWLSNPSIATLFVPLFYLGILMWNKGYKWGVWISSFGLGLAIHSELFLLYHLIIFLILLVTGIFRPSKKTLVIFIGILSIILLPMFLTELYFGSPFIKGLENLMESGKTTGMFWFIGIYTDYLAKLFSNNLFPLNVSYAGLFGLGLIIWLAVNHWSKFSGKLLVFYLLSSITALPFGGSSNSFVNVGLGMGACALFGLFIYQISQSRKLLPYILILVVIILNLVFIFIKNPEGNPIFAIQPSLSIRNERMAMDYIYDSQKNIPFSLNTLTSPLYINTTWSYLFNWYGKNKYGFLPYWHGHDQIGLLGNNLTRPPSEVIDYYLIIDPPEPNFVKYIEPGIREEEGFSRLIEEKQFGQIRVQKRLKL